VWYPICEYQLYFKIIQAQWLSVSFVWFCSNFVVESFMSHCKAMFPASTMWRHLFETIITPWPQRYKPSGSVLISSLKVCLPMAQKCLVEPLGAFC